MESVSHRSIVPEFARPLVTLVSVVPRATGYFALWDCSTIKYIQDVDSLVGPDGVAALNHLRDKALHRLIQSPSSLIQSPLLLLNRWHNNYYHFLLETLPAILESCRRSGDILQSPIVIDRGSRFCAQVLRWLGFNGYIHENLGRGLCLDGPSIVNISYLPEISFNALMTRVQELRSLFDGLVHSASTSSLPQKIFIERRSGGSFTGGQNRRFFPQDKFHQDLRSMGYTLVYLEDMSVMTQIRLFACAKRIACVHGAGLANIIFSAPHCKITEFVSSEAPRPTCFEVLAKASHLSRYSVCASSSNLEPWEIGGYFEKMSCNYNVSRLPLRYNQHIRETLLDG